MGELVLAADLGGTNLRMAAVGPSGEIAERVRRSTPHSDDPMVIVDAIGEMATEIQAAVGAKRLTLAIGVAAPVIMDARNGSVYKAPNLPAINGFNFAGELSKKLGLRVILENDATAAAIGEHWLGAARNVENAICVTLGTGVGGGIILSGQPLRGPDGTAGEIGHICVEPNGHPCGCGSWGCLEQYSSAMAVVRIARELTEEKDRSWPGGMTAEKLYEAAKAGDDIAIEAFRRLGYYLGIVLASLINVVDPDMIVLAGGLSGGWDVFIDETCGQIAKRAFRLPALRAKLVRAELGDDAGILGVARLALETPDQGLLES